MPLSVLLSAPSTLDFPGMAFQALSSSTTLPPFHTGREWNQTSTHNTQRSHQRRPYSLLVQVPLIVRCPPGPQSSTSAPGPAFSHVEERQISCFLPRVLQGGGAEMCRPAPRSQYGEADLTGFVLSLGLQSPHSPLPRGLGSYFCLWIRYGTMIY